MFEKPPCSLSMHVHPQLIYRRGMCQSTRFIHVTSHMSGIMLDHEKIATPEPHEASLQARTTPCGLSGVIVRSNAVLHVRA